jgi:hypothetical protein
MSQSIREAAKTYVPKSAKNITELPVVSADSIIMKEIGNQGMDDEYEYNYIEFNQEKYRVPDSVLKDLKAILAKKPTLQHFAVTKTGEGRQTKYTVIPMD